MKKILLFFVALTITGSLYAQDELRRGYIGICVGPAFPMGDIDGSAVEGGAQTNLVNFGYRFSRNVGIAATWFGNSFTSKYDDQVAIGMGGLMAGPLFTTASKSGKAEFDLKPMIGFGRGTTIVHNQSGSSEMVVALGLGGTARWNCGKYISLSAGLDYIYAKPEGINLSSFAILFGINYRIK